MAKLTLAQADSYRYTTAGKFSAPFHYIDALDSPPSSCGVDYTRDCGTGGCVVSAINNYVSPIFEENDVVEKFARHDNGWRGVTYGKRLIDCRLLESRLRA